VEPEFRVCKKKEKKRRMNNIIQQGQGHIKLIKSDNTLLLFFTFPALMSTRTFQIHYKIVITTNI